MASKKDKLNRLKRAARHHIDETIAKSSEAQVPPRSSGDMRDFMENMEADRKVSSGSGAPGDTERPDGAPRAGESDAAVMSGGSSEHMFVEVDSDLAEASSEAHSPDSKAGGALPASSPEEFEPEIGLPKAGPAPAYAGKAAARPEKSMPKTRDSIYNVSSDIRLEDYTEGSGGGSGRMGTVARVGGVIVILALLGWGGMQLATWLTAPVYRLAIANELIDESNAEAIAGRKSIVLRSSAPVHIQFAWEEGQLTTDWLRMEIRDSAGIAAAEERRPPRTANYIYFRGPLDPGTYEIQVQDREKVVLVKREFRVN